MSWNILAVTICLDPINTHMKCKLFVVIHHGTNFNDTFLCIEWEVCHI